MTTDGAAETAASGDRPAPDDPDATGLAAALATLRHEAASVAALSDRLDAGFLAVVDRILACRGRVVVTGIGKSGIIGRKIAATLASTGTPAAFVHATEALHGDSGMVTADDMVIAISASGETVEVCAFARMLTGRDIPVVALVGRTVSSLCTDAAHVLDVSVPGEADPLGLAPTASTTATLAMGDALAAALIVRRGFTARDFAAFHPGGSLGRKLAGDGPPGTTRERGR